MNTQKRIIGLDVLRGLSAILIMLYHYTSRYNDLDSTSAGHVDWGIELHWGCLAVITFFIISGYLSSRYLTTETSPLQFISRRIKRLYPTFWAALLITTCVILLTGYEHVTVRDFLLNITMLPSIFGAKPIDGVYWTQQYELIFYVIIFFLLLLNNRRFTRFFLLSWLLFSILFFFVQENNNGLIIRFLRVFTIPNYCAAFIAGIQIKMFENRNERVWSIAVFLLCSLAFALWHSIKHLLFFIVIIALVLIVIYIPTVFLNQSNWFTRPLVFVASISYPLYLVHQKIGYIVMYNIVTHYCITTEFLVLIPIIVSFVLAYLLHIFVERVSD